MNNPFFSIIVVSYNAEDTISETIKSVLSQSFTDYEIIVKDACSTDNTLTIIPNDEKLKIYVNKDNGIYYGMNEAIGYCKGKFLCFLNCGDIFVDNQVLSKIYESAVKIESDSVVIYGDYLRKGVYFKQPSKITPFYLFKTPICHQTEFFSSDIFKNYGYYNVNYKICADYELTLRTFFKNVNYTYINLPVCSYLGGGMSESKRGIKIKKEDYKSIIKRYYSLPKRILYNFLLILSFKHLRKLINSKNSPEWIKKMYRRVINKVNR